MNGETPPGLRKIALGGLPAHLSSLGAHLGASLALWADFYLHFQEKFPRQALSNHFFSPKSPHNHGKKSAGPHF